MRNHEQKKQHKRDMERQTKKTNKHEHKNYHILGAKSKSNMETNMTPKTITELET